MGKKGIVYRTIRSDFSIRFDNSVWLPDGNSDLTSMVGHRFAFRPDPFGTDVLSLVIQDNVRDFDIIGSSDGWAVFRRVAP